MKKVFIHNILIYSKHEQIKQTPWLISIWKFYFWKWFKAHFSITISFICQQYQVTPLYTYAQEIYIIINIMSFKKLCNIFKINIITYYHIHWFNIHSNFEFTSVIHKNNKIRNQSPMFQAEEIFLVKREINIRAKSITASINTAHCITDLLSA
jgi:hypothetical protein